MNKNLILILTLLLLILIISGCDETSTDEDINESREDNTQIQNISSETQQEEVKIEDYTFIQRITYEDNHSKSVITKNKILKIATIEMDLYYEGKWGDFKQGDFLTNFTVALPCGLMALAFFNQTALETLLEEWNNSQGLTIKDDSPPEEKEEEPQENPLEGYEVTKVTLYFKYKSTGDKFAECILAGAEASDINIKFY